MTRSAPALGARRGSNPHPDPNWSDADIAAVAFRCHAHGATEDATRVLLQAFSAARVSRLRAYVDAMPDRDLIARLRAADAAVSAAAEVGMPGRRGDIRFMRTPRRWPWRTSTSQTFGGAA